MRNVGFSYRSDNDYIVFDNQDIQKLWEQNSTSREKGIGPLPHLHMVVDIIESFSKKWLRLLTIYDSKEKKYITDEEMIEQFAVSSELIYNVDRNGEYMKSGNYCFEDDDFDDYPNMTRDSDGFYSGKCKCGGNAIPMYDEHPFWIIFCNRCDRRWENTESSPLPY